MTPLDLPPTTYFVCATPRSGSTLLCESLKRTGVAGCPEEYFEALRGTDVPRQPRQYFDGIPPDLEELLPLTRQQPAPELAQAATYADYLRWVLEQGTTGNGVFGAKLMWGYLADFVGRLREIEGITGTDPGAVLLEAFPGARFVRIVRRQKLAQAVSLWKAIQTQHWRAAQDGDVARTEPVYHRHAIALLAHQLYDHERRWSRFFAAHRIEPLTLSYDDIVGDLDGSVRGVLDHVGIETPSDLRIEPPLERQADARSQAWAERFVADQRSEASRSA